MLSPWLTTAKSAFPSPLKSATATEYGFVPTVNGLPPAAVNPPLPFPSNTVTVLSPQSATAKSGLPSPLKSATAVARGFVPAAKGVAVKPVAG